MSPLLIGSASTHVGVPATGLAADVHRFAVSWAELQPGAVGDLVEGALARVRDDLDRLRADGVQTVLVLHRDDSPPAGHRDWTERAAAEAFAGYSRRMARALGTRVDLWTTFDAPPPGGASGASFAAAHHRVLAHGLASRAIREVLPDAALSFSLGIRATRPEDPSDAAALEAVGAIDRARHHLYLGPLLEGSYPTDLIAGTRRVTDWSFVRRGDLLTSRQKLDVLQVTYQDTSRVRIAGGAVEEAVRGPGRVDPQGLTDVLRSLDTVFPAVPLLTCTACPPGADPVGYHSDHLARVEQAAGDGVPVRAHLMQADDAEWSGPLADWYAGTVARYRESRTAVEPVEEAGAPEPRRWLRRLRGRRS